MPNDRVYLWEYVHLDHGARQIAAAAYTEYMRLQAEVWAPAARETRGMILLFTAKVIGHTGAWPVCINIYEFAGFRGQASVLTTEYLSQSDLVGTDDTLRDWWVGAAKVRDHGFDKILAPAPFCPTAQDIVDNDIRCRAMIHEVVKVEPRTAGTYFERLEREFLPIARRLGMRLVGSYKTASKNDSEAINVWTLSDFDQWAAVEEAYQSDPELQQWIASTEGLVHDWERSVLFPHPACPPVSGRII
jgi:hypothetical protein